uniref:Transcription factor 23 n=1 Tax=Apteryx owenii TaxID=8824 RepID=A0A8B9NTH0_APTOW
MAESSQAGGCGAGPAAERGSPTAVGSRGIRSPPRAGTQGWRARPGGAGRAPHPSTPRSSPAGRPARHRRGWRPSLATGQRGAWLIPLSPQGAAGPLSPGNAARERSRVRTLRQAFVALQAALPAVPPGTKLSKLDVLVLATSYIAHLGQALGRGPPPPGTCHPPHGHRLLHPVRKWPMRSRLYIGPWGGPAPDPPMATAAPSSPEDAGCGDRQWESTP